MVDQPKFGTDPLDSFHENAFYSQTMGAYAMILHVVEHETWQLAKVPEVTSILSFCPGRERGEV